jgi:hypothetical protein
MSFRFVECEQGSDEWMSARAGICTASRFADAVSTVGGLTDQQKLFVKLVREDKIDEKAAAASAGYKAVPRSSIIAKALAGEDTAQPSDTAKRYAADLAIERVSGKPFGIPPKTWLLDRGHEMERLARMAYEETHTSFVTEAGICLLDAAPFGYSSDGLVNDEGLIEIKAPMWQTGDVSEYIHQIMGGLWITGREYVDFIMYVPDLAPVGKDLYVKRIYRDEEFIDDMVNKLWRFDLMVQEYTKTLMEAA